LQVPLFALNGQSDGDAQAVALTAQVPLTALHCALEVHTSPSGLLQVPDIGQSPLTVQGPPVELQVPLPGPMPQSACVVQDFVVLPAHRLKPVQSALDEHCFVVCTLQVPKIVGQSPFTWQLALLMLQVPT
jgi:hypothetical protein